MKNNKPTIFEIMARLEEKTNYTYPREEVRAAWFLLDRMPLEDAQKYLNDVQAVIIELATTNRSNSN